MGHRDQAEAAAPPPPADEPARASRRIRSRRRDQGRRSGPGVPAGPPLGEIADEAVAAFRSQTFGMRCGSGVDADAAVRVVVRTPEVVTDPSRLEIWVLLGDVADTAVPARWDPTEVIADPDLTGWALMLRAAMIGHLVALDWPTPQHVTVRFDTAERVERRGGRSYVAA